MIILTIIIFILYYSLPFIKNNINSLYLRRITAISLLYSGVLCLNTLNFQVIGSGIGIYSGLFQVTLLSSLITIFILIISSIIILTWPNLENYNTSSTLENLSISNINLNLKTPSLENVKTITYNYNDNSSKSKEYCLIILFNILGALLLITSSDLISIYLSIELQSFGLYILSTLYNSKLSATSAGLKYFLLGGLSSCFILLGSGIIYSYSGLTNLESIYSILSVYTNFPEIGSNINSNVITLDYNNIIPEFAFVPENLYAINNFFHYAFSYALFENKTYSYGIYLGFLFIFSGFLFKIAASPFHNWAPDVYDESPTLVTIWLTIMPKISILILLLEFLIGSCILSNSLFDSILSGSDNFNLNFISDISNIDYKNIPLFYSFNDTIISNLLLLSSLLSLLIGAFVGLSQIKIKRLLAYSTINHVGFLLLSLSILSNSSIESFIFYILQYTITNLNIFLIILAFAYIYKVNKKFNNDNTRDVDSEKKVNSYNLNDIENIIELKGLFLKNPLLSISFSICLFSFAGVPPLIGFFAKQQVLYSANSAGYFFLSFIAIFVSVISASYYLKIIKIIFSPSSLGGIGNTLNSFQANNSLDNDSLITTTQTIESRNNILHYNQIPNNFLTSSKFINKGTVIRYKTIKMDLSSVHSFIIGLLTLVISLFIFNPDIVFNTISIITNSLLNI